MRKVLHLAILTWNFAEKNFSTVSFFKDFAKLLEHIFRTPLSRSSYLPDMCLGMCLFIQTLAQNVKSVQKLTIKTSERCHWRRAGVFIGNTVQISLIVLKFWLLNLIKKFSDGNVNKTKTNYVTSVYLSLRMILNSKKNSDPFPFPRSRVFFVHQEIFEKPASVVPLGPLDFLAASFAELKIFLDMKLDHRRYYEHPSCIFLVSFTSEFWSKLDGVILPGSVDDEALPVLTKKNRDHINNFKNLQKVLLM